MKVLFDNGVPNAIPRSLPAHEVTFARKIGWQELKNGALLQRAEEFGFDLFLSNDKNIEYQQNLAHRKIAIVVLSTSQWPDVQGSLEEIAKAVDDSTPGSYVEVKIQSRKN